MNRVVILFAIAFAARAHAHDLRPGILSFVEASPGELRMRFVPPIDSRGEAVELALVLPEGCTRTAELVHCKHGFGGELAVGGMRGHAMKIYVSLERAGVRRDWILTSEAPRLDLGPAPSRLAAIGIDALALVFGLLLVLGVSMRLAGAVAAFVAAEVLASFLHVPHAPIAACVAASVLLVAREATHDRDTAIRRLPWLAGALFGLVHGLAYSPPPLYLLGQLGVIAVAVALVAAGRRLIGERRIVGLRAHRAACYALGALAAWWLLTRTAHLACG